MAQPFGHSMQTWVRGLTASAVLWLSIAGTVTAQLERLPPSNDAQPILVAPQATLLSDHAPAADIQPAETKSTSAAVFDGLVDVLKGDKNAVEASAPQNYSADNAGNYWTWQLLPSSLIYHSYLAGAKEPRLGSFFAYDKYHGWMWDITLGGRVGLLRYGSQDGLRPQGWQFDLEGAAFPRLDLMNNEDLMASDFRAGAPLTYGYGDYQFKFAMYHLSSHAGDEYMLSNPTFNRINYSRNVLVWGHSYYFDAWRVYAEAGWAFDFDVSKPWEFQAGVEYSPVCPSAPFAALNLHSREEVDFGGNIVLQAGWQWRAASRLFRIGFEYYDGQSDQFEFFDNTEQKVGVGFWYDF